MWQFSEAIDGITEICTALGVPVIGGNVSFYNEAYGSDIDPTPVVSTIGYRPLPTHPVPDPRRASGSVILVTTGETPSLSGSVFAEIIGDRRGSFPAIDLERLNHLLGVIAELVTADDLVNAATNLGAGGLLAGVVHLARLAGKGLRIELEDASVEALLAEHPSRFLLVTEQPTALVDYLSGEGLETVIIGELGGGSIEFEDWLRLPIERGVA